MIYQSYYFNDENMPLHSVELRLDNLDDKNTASLIIDENTCGLNIFGDKTICTKKNTIFINCVLSRIRLGDPKNLGRKVYLLQQNLYEYKFWLITDNENRNIVISVEKSNNNEAEDTHNIIGVIPVKQID